MSGRKRIYVDEGEWQRLQQQAATFAQVNRDVPRLIQEVSAQTERDLARNAAEFEARHGQIEQTLQGLSETTHRIESETSRRIDAAARQARQDVKRATLTLRAETRELVAQEAQARKAELEEERRVRQEEFGRLGSRIEELEQDRAAVARLSAQWLADARTLSAAIELLPHERFAPDELDRLQAKLNTVERNQGMGYGAGDLGVVQGYFHDLSDLRSRVEREDLTYRQLQARAESGLRTVEALIGQNTRLRLAEGAKTEQEEQLEVDYWSLGALGRLSAQVEKDLCAVQDESSPLTTEQLELLRTETTQRYEAELAQVVAEAGTALYASQLRSNFADVIVQVLEDEHFFSYDESAYAGADPRNGFYARARHLDGSEVVVQVEPSAESAAPACTVRILNFDESTDSTETRGARSTSIQQSLAVHGLAVTGVAEEQGEPEPELRDIEAIRRGEVRTHAEGRSGGTGQTG